MNAPSRPPRGLARTPGQQLLLFALIGVAVVVLLTVGLTMAAGPSGLSAGIDPATKTITVSIEQEPPQLDSGVSMDAVSGMVLGHVMEGLLRRDASGALAPGVAERWEVGATGATFWLRADAKWSDGKPVTARDFLFAWRRVVDPATASEYANILSGIRNADAINSGRLPATALGVEAIGDRVLEVQFERPMPFFDQLTATAIFLPVREDFWKATRGRYASSAGTLLYNGPFTMTKWVHGAHIRMEKNPHYWDRDQIALNVIDIPYFTADPVARINLFRDGKIALSPITPENLEEAQLLGWTIRSFNEGPVFYVEFNHRAGRLSSNRNFRKAIQHALDPVVEVNKVIKAPGYLPGKSLFPVWLEGVEGKFREEYPVPEVTPDTARARAYLERARQELGLEAFPPIMLLTPDTPIPGRVAEHYQDRLKRELGLDVRIDRQIFKQMLAKALAGEFDMRLGGWSADYADPLTFADLFMTGNQQNRGQYSNPALDRQVEIARNSIDPKTRMDAFGAIQAIIVDDAVILPSYERTLLYVVDPRLSGVVRRTIGGDPDYSRARIVAD